jgi:hypothetical protein
MALSRLAHQRVTQAVETVEKVPFRKLIFGKWDKNIEKCLVFCVPNNILAIFESVVGDFSEDFSSEELFDSLVGSWQGRATLPDRDGCSTLQYECAKFPICF